MPLYAVRGDQNVAASPGATNFGVTGTATRRVLIMELIFGCEGTPADNNVQWLLRRYTDPGTSTAVTPRAVDPSDGVATITAGSNHTVEPTYTANSELIDIGLHIRALFTWKAAKEAFAYIGPAVAANGLGLTPVHASVVLNTRATARVIE